MEDKNNVNLECTQCNYKTNSNSLWLRHINTDKHKRNGAKKTTKCDICEYESNSHWNIKMHKLQKHSSKEEKLTHKYYCKDCDIVLMCSAYYTSHINGKVHKNQVLVNNSKLTI